MRNPPRKLRYVFHPFVGFGVAVGDVGKGPFGVLEREGVGVFADAGDEGAEPDDVQADRRLATIANAAIRLMAMLGTTRRPSGDPARATA